jgi:hypothetical protein
MEVSEASCEIWMSAIHAGTTKISFSCRRAEAHETVRGSPIRMGNSKFQMADEL